GPSASGPGIKIGAIARSHFGSLVEHEIPRVDPLSATEVECRRMTRLDPERRMRSLGWSHGQLHITRLVIFALEGERPIAGKCRLEKVDVFERHVTAA